MNFKERKLLDAEIRKLINKWRHFKEDKYNTDLIDIYIVLKGIMDTLKEIVKNMGCGTKRKPKRK